MLRALAAVLLIAATSAACGGASTRKSAPDAHVASTVPEDGATGVSLATTITVAFDREMDPDSITSSAGGSCEGSVQVSADAFVTCVAMAGAVASDGNLVFELVPAEQLAPDATYRVRVTAAAATAAGGEARSFTMEDGFTTTTAPEVVATIPADGALALASSGLSITFDRAMDPGTITGNSSSSACTGAVQLSTSSAFATCLRLADDPASGDDTTFVFEAALPLRATATHYVRVTRAAEAADGSALASVFTSGGFTTRYSHTIAIDGVNDFTAAEQFATSTGSFTGWLAWDSANLYLGFDGPDVGMSSATKFLLIYLGGAGGGTTGESYNTQTPALPFDARWHVRWRTDEAFLGTEEWDGMDWAVDTWTPPTFNAGDFIEMAIPLAELGAPATAALHVSMINEVGGGEFTFAGLPSSSFADSFDPDYGAFYEVDFSGLVSPADLVPQ